MAGINQDIFKTYPVCGRYLWQNFTYDIVGNPLLTYHCSYCKTKFYESTQRQRSYTSNSAKESGVEK